ncbi:MAG TPA: hypothetical protein VH442_04590, partial [Micromonosporaceae bacterium]
MSKVSPADLPASATPPQVAPAPGPAPAGDFTNPPPINGIPKVGSLSKAQLDAPFDMATAPVVDRSAASTTWQRPDGAYTSRVFSEPVRFKDAKGAWRDIDASLVPDGTGGASAAALPFDVSIGKDTTSALVQVGADGWSVGFTL